MRILLDTHVLLWALIEDARLRSAARTVIEDGRNAVFVSAASTWEITIKRSLGKLDVPDDLAAQLQAARFEVLAITVEHTLAVGDLPDHHRDPFDRLLVAQARVANLTLLTADPAICRYDVATLRV